MSIKTEIEAFIDSIIDFLRRLKESILRRIGGE